MALSFPPRMQDASPAFRGPAGDDECAGGGGDFRLSCRRRPVRVAVHSLDVRDAVVFRVLPFFHLSLPESGHERLCCFALSLLPLSAFAYPIEVDPQLNGTEVYSTQDIGRDMGAILLTNLGGQAAECTAVFRNGPETPKVRKGVIQPGQNSNFTAQFGRDIIKLRIKLT